MRERSQVLQEISRVLLRHKEEYAALMGDEMGKSLQEGRAEIEKCATTAIYYAEEGPEFLRPEPVKTEAAESFISYEPLGLVLAIMPWNFPFWQAFRCAIPAILAGNAVALKHATNVTGCALAIEKCWREALGPHGNLFQTLLAPGARALDLIASPEVSAVSFTGSTEVGRKIAAAAGSSLKKCVLELGGSDPYVVLADADVEKAAEACAQSRLINSGQSCIAAKRFIVEKSTLEDFLHVFAQELQRPLAPLARKDLREELQKQVDQSVARGAKLLMGGKIPQADGWLYPPTLLRDVRPGMAVFDEETFGPVAAVVEAENADEAIALANKSPFGLGAAVFTKDLKKGIHLAKEELEAGSCFVNAFVRSDPRLPFGGIKESGFGRELSAAGIREFVNTKTVYAGA